MLPKNLAGGDGPGYRYVITQHGATVMVEGQRHEIRDLMDCEPPEFIARMRARVVELVNKVQHSADAV